MIRYYCSGLANDDYFGHGLGDMIKKELKDTKCIVFVPGDPNNIDIINEKYIPLIYDSFKRCGIVFDKEIIITPKMSTKEAKNAIKEANFIMMMGGDPYDEKEMCEKLDIVDDLRKFDGVMLGSSAGSMYMSKYIIITPCSEDYPEFHIEEGLNLDNISIYPHNNTNKFRYPKFLAVRDEIYDRDDFITAAKEYGEFYLLQDYYREDGLSDVSIIKSVNGRIEIYRENKGRVWLATKDGIKYIKK